MTEYTGDEDIYQTRYEVGDIVEHNTYPTDQTYLILEAGYLGPNTGMLRYYAMNLKTGERRYFNYLFDIQSNPPRDRIPLSEIPDNE